MRRVAVVGTSGAGKTTLARALAARLAVPHVELDALHWEPGWTAAEPEVFTARLEAALAGDGWVADGNYSHARPIVWGRADTLVWLDYAWAVVLGRLLRRTAVRSWRREELWNGNREDLRLAFSRESIVLWMLRTWGRNRRRYGKLSADPEWGHLAVVRLRSPRAADRWLASLPPAPAGEG